MFCSLCTDAFGAFRSFTQAVIPYWPYFSSCRGYDSFISIWELLESENCELPELTESGQSKFATEYPERVKKPALPDFDDITVVEPLSGIAAMFSSEYVITPIADHCTLSLKCKYEEDLASKDLRPRWFEAPTGTVLMSMKNVPSTLEQYFKGAQGIRELLESNQISEDNIVGLEVNRDNANLLEEKCSYLCYPRKMNLEIRYYQVNENKKRIIAMDLVFDAFDRNQSNDDYEIQLSYRALDYVELIIAFAFEDEVFVTLFIIIGIGTVLVAFALYVLNRFTTQLEHPPRLKLNHLLYLISAPAISGVTVALLPIWLVKAFVIALLDAGSVSSTVSQLSNAAAFNASDPSTIQAQELYLLERIPSNYHDSSISRDDVEDTKQARYGVCFIALALYLLTIGVRIMVPLSVSRREQELKALNDVHAARKTVWLPTAWKRSNLFLASIGLSIFLVMMVEFSLWTEFGTYIWYFILAMNLLVNTILVAGLKWAVGEELLVCPLESALGITLGLVTFGANNFLDFVVGYLIEFGMLLLHRLYYGPWFDMMASGAHQSLLWVFRSSRRRLGYLTVEEISKKIDEEEVQNVTRDIPEEVEGNETIEPILANYSSYSTELIGLLYSINMILILMVFRDAVDIPGEYGIKKKDMRFYLWFAIVIAPFQMISDVLVMNVQELFHGWKLYDYLIYARYRYTQRESRWKGFETNLDECIEEGMRTVDQMCFSSQYYAMTTLYVTGVIYLALGIQILIRKGHNPFGDPATIILICYVLFISVLIQRASMYVADKLRLWHLKHEGTDWLNEEPDDDFDAAQWDELDDIKGASHEAYLMNQKITNESFRHKFLDYNRSWLVQQLPSILTPRTLRRARPYLITQLTKILGSVNPDISSESENDEAGMRQFGPVALSASSRAIIRLWLAKARRRKALLETVQPLMNRARKAECEQCLSRKQLQVELLTPIDVLGDRFEAEFPSEEFDQVAWKNYFQLHGEFKTLCLPCIKKYRDDNVQQQIALQSGGLKPLSKQDQRLNLGPVFGPVHLSAASKAMMLKWLQLARDHARKRGIRTGVAAADISDDEDSDDDAFLNTKARLHLSAASKAILQKWLALGRESLAKNGRETTFGTRRRGKGKRSMFGL